MSKQAEVQFGLAQEERIAMRWLNVKEDPVGSTLIKAGDFADFDFYVVNGSGLLHAYLEVKMRRKPLSAFGDAMFPARKHETALLAREIGNIPFLAVTEYACGTLVEVDLTDEPSFRRDIKRRDRPGMAAVPHIFYTKDRMKVLSVG